MLVPIIQRYPILIITLNLSLTDNSNNYAPSFFRFLSFSTAFFTTINQPFFLIQMLMLHLFLGLCYRHCLPTMTKCWELCRFVFDISQLFLVLFLFMIYFCLALDKNVFFLLHQQKEEGYFNVYNVSD